jgi:hypothetical protein
LGSIGFAMASTSSSTSFSSFSNGQPAFGGFQNNSAAGPSESGPIVQLGAGGEYVLGKDMGIFLQVKYSMIFVGATTFNGYPVLGYTFSSIPIQAGVNFDF